MRLDLEYVTFDEFAETVDGIGIKAEILETNRKIPIAQLASLYKSVTIEELEKKINTLSHNKQLENEDKIAILLHWHAMLDENKDKSDEEICAQVMARCKVSGAQERLIRADLARGFHEIYQGLVPNKEINPKQIAPVILNRKLPEEDKHIAICLLVPIVPIASVFTIYIYALLNELLKALYRLNGRKAITLEYLCNFVTYGRIIEEIAPKHFAYDPDLRYEDLQAVIEDRFLAFANLLLLDSSWDNESQAFAYKVNFLKNVNMIGRVQAREQVKTYSSFISGMQSRRMLKQKVHEQIVVGGIKDYIGPINSQQKAEELDLISFLAAEIVRRVKQNSQQQIFCICPLPDALLLEDTLTESEKENVYLAAYLPFPLEPSIRKDLPFHFNWYSPYVYEETGKLQNDKMSLRIQKEYARKLLISVLQRLSLTSVGKPYWEDYPSTLSGVRKIFERIDEEMDRQLQYIF